VNILQSQKKDPSYHKIRIDYKQGLIEGRITQEFVDEMRQQPFFGVLYECITPKSDTTDERGWDSIINKKRYRERIHRASQWIRYQ